MLLRKQPSIPLINLEESGRQADDDGDDSFF